MENLIGLMELNEMYKLVYPNLHSQNTAAPSVQIPTMVQPNIPSSITSATNIDPLKVALIFVMGAGTFYLGYQIREYFINRYNRGCGC